MLSKLMALSRAELKAKLASIDVSAVRGRSLKRRFEAIRNKKQGGFTLLELLVVVLILAAISGTATIMLHDTDKRAAAGAHVAMMDELSKGIMTYRVLHQGKYPDVWESLLSAPGANTVALSNLSTAVPLAILSADLNGTIDQNLTLSQNQVDAFNDVGITRVRVVAQDAKALDEDGGELSGTPCDNSSEENIDGIRKTILSKNNNIVASNVYRPVGANGCGFDAHYVLKNGDKIFQWVGDLQRIGIPVGATTGPIAVFGVGPDSTLFQPSEIGALSNVPVYRHVENWEYPHFLVLFNLTDDVAVFQAIIDGAGDTKDEELGEIDNTRPT
ncbi:MAG: prepilin-type N-terminal cleavage/methylation domain-containing protein [Zoogloeaceae bacterium]|jgi:prepilin-type N-terminal cleavage/methylation domain-containing protein|nr:prepilin-type N-terminal cleavage/methylation domain-containing protein [Zoogloeaceae bacterium]